MMTDADFTAARDQRVAWLRDQQKTWAISIGLRALAFGGLWGALSVAGVHFSPLQEGVLVVAAALYGTAISIADTYVADARARQAAAAARDAAKKV